MPEEKIKEFKTTTNSWVHRFPHLISSNEQLKFYEDLLNDYKEKTYKEDNISHFGCRLLYCHDSANHAKFIEMEKLLLDIRLRRRYDPKNKTSRYNQMNLLKNMLASYLGRNPEELNVPQEDW